ncbi:MAG TPA: thermonuclease family protein [Phycisphaerae bacterium]|nr:thermonuclease family protein [Phycisphaerae bacterium]
MARRRKTPASITLPPIWRRRPILTLVLVLLVGLMVYGRVFAGLGQNDDYTRYHDKVFEVAYLVDGDTLDIDVPDGRHPTTRIRLWGVDAPEVTGGRQRGMHYGSEASAFAKRRLMGRRVRVVLSPSRTRGKYGRLLAYVYLEPSGVMFNELLLENGYAYADRRFPHPYKRQFKSIEERARKQGVGLWADVTADQMPEWRRRMEGRAE